MSKRTSSDKPAFTRTPDEIRQDPEDLQIMRTMGKKSGVPVPEMEEYVNTDFIR